MTNESTLVPMEMHNLLTAGPAAWTDTRVPSEVWYIARATYGSTDLEDEKRAYRTVQAVLWKAAQSPAHAVAADEQTREITIQDEEVEWPDVDDMAHSAVQEAFSFGISHDVFKRHMLCVMFKTAGAFRAALAQRQQGQASAVKVEVPDGMVLVSLDRLRKVFKLAKMAGDNIVAHSKAGKGMTGWLDDACTYADSAGVEVAAMCSAVSKSQPKAVQPLTDADGEKLLSDFARAVMFGSLKERALKAASIKAAMGIGTTSGEVQG